MATKKASPLFHWARTLHAYAGAGLSALIFVIAFSGALLVFKDDYIKLTTPAARAALTADALTAGEAAEEAERLFGAETVKAVVFADPSFGLHKVYFTDKSAAYMDRNGALIDRWEKNGRVEDWVFDFHHHLLSGETGELVAGLAGLAAVLLVLGGLVAVWPMRRGLRRGLTIDAPSRTQLRSVHRNLGAYAAAPILLSLLSGVFMAFPATSKDLFGVIGKTKEPASVDRPRAAVDEMAGDETTGDIDWLIAGAEAAERFPDAAPRIAIWPRDGGPAMIRLRQPAEWHPNGRTVVYIDPASGRAFDMVDAEKLGLGDRAFNAVYPVHAAHTGGRLYDAVVFLTGVALSALSFLGAWSFLKKWRDAPSRRASAVTAPRGRRTAPASPRRKMS